MLRRNRTVGDRLKNTLPVFTLVGLGAVMVLIGMNILVVATPVVIPTPSPSSAASVPSFPVIPSYAIGTDVPTSSEAAVASLPATAPTILVRHLDEQDPDGIWDVSLAYPTFQTDSTPYAADMNDQIAALERSQADRFEQGPAAVRLVAGRTNHLIGDYTTDLVTPELAAFSFSWSAYITPGQTAVTIGTVNLDLSTGQAISFDDMFMDPQAALEILSTQSADLLYYQLGAAWNETQGQLGTAPSYGNFGNWVLTRAGLKIIFGQYQVVGSSQIVAVVVPWSALLPVLRSDGPVAVLSGAGSAAGNPIATPTSGLPAGATPSPLETAAAFQTPQP